MSKDFCQALITIVRFHFGVCLIRQAVIGKFSHNTGYINKNLKERRRSKNPIRRNINIKRKRSTKELEMEKHQKDRRKETERNTG